jgi:C_GCAxxG_C_C family probable redox protein
MEKATEKALANFNHGFNCAQAVLSAFCEKYGLGMELASKIAGGMGSGFRSGDICGAVSGAVMVIGLKYGPGGADDLQAKPKCYEKTEEFIRAFREGCGFICCRDILGCDLSTPNGRKQAEKDDLFNTVCVDAVKTSIHLLEELGY